MIDTTGKCSACGQTVGIDTIHTCSPQMTAPTPERRVGEERPRVEAERVAHLAGMSDETVAGNFPAGGTMRALSRDLLDARTALIEVSGALHTEHQRVISLTAEVERLREAGERFLYAIEGEGIVEAPTSEARSRFRNAISPRIPVSVEGATNE